SFAMPCAKPADSPVAYKVDPYHWTPSVTAVQQPHIQIFGSEGLFPVCVDVNFFDDAIPPIVTTYPVFDVTGAGHTVDMGALQKNNVNPTVSSFPVFSGVEGSPVTFSAVTTSACPISSYVWQFSDGTTSFGKTPQRAFGDDGVFNGQLTVTDITNL